MLPARPLSGRALSRAGPRDLKPHGAGVAHQRLMPCQRLQKSCGCRTRVVGLVDIASACWGENPSRAKKIQLPGDTSGHREMSEHETRDMQCTAKQTERRRHRHSGSTCHRAGISHSHACRRSPTSLPRARTAGKGRRRLTKQQSEQKLAHGFGNHTSRQRNTNSPIK